MENGVKRETSFMENKIRNINGGGGKYPGMHKHSQTISKMKPKIRIIHIFAPEIIHTDVHNFRQLVQSLTGKPTGCQNSGKRTEQATHISQQSRERLMIKEEEQQGFYDGQISSGRYLRGLDGFISEFGHFPFFPNRDAYHRHAQDQFEGTLLS